VDEVSRAMQGRVCDGCSVLVKYQWRRVGMQAGDGNGQRGRGQAKVCVGGRGSLGSLAESPFERRKLKPAEIRGQN